MSGDSGPIGRADLKSLRIHRSDRDVDEYVRRDAHDQLLGLARKRTLVLVEGPSMAGKTRLVVEVLREEWPDTRVLFPKGNDDVEKLLKNRQKPIRGAIIVWTGALHVSHCCPTAAHKTGSSSAQFTVVECYRFCGRR